MKNRDKILNKLHDLYKQIDRAEDMIEACGDVGDLTGVYCWDDTRKHLETEVALLRRALSQAGTFWTFANPATSYDAGVWA